MNSRQRGSRDLEVFAIGLSCVGLHLIRMAFEKGVTFFVTTENFGPFINEDLVSEQSRRFAIRL